jgi:DnaJ-domain-containing protein 1
MGWLEFAVIVGCCLVGFIIMNAIIDARRTKAEGQQKDGDAKNQDSGSKDEDPTKKTDDRQRRTSPPRSWWETLNVDQNASTEQIKSAFRKEISKYHPDRVEGLGVELRELAGRMAKEVNHAYTLAKQQRGFK